MQEDWSFHPGRNARILGRIEPKLHEGTVYRVPILPRQSLSIEPYNNQGSMS